MDVEEVKSEDFMTNANELIADIDSKLAEELRNIQAELLNYSTKLVFEVATCECGDREECGVFNIAKEIAKIMKELQDKAMVTVRSASRAKEVKKRK